MALARDSDTVADLGEVDRFDDPDVLEQRCDPLSAGKRARVLAERLGARRGPALPGAASRPRREQHRQRPEPARPRFLGELERAPRVGRDDRRRPGRERRGDGPLVAGIDVEQRERQRLAPVGKRPCGGWKTLAFGKAPLECDQTVGGESGRGLERLALVEGGARRASRFAEGALRGGELVERRRVVRRVGQGPRPGRLPAQRRGRLDRVLVPDRQALGPASQAVERRGRLLVPAGGLLELLLCPPALCQDALEALVTPPALLHGPGTLPFQPGESVLEGGQPAGEEARPDPVDLDGELLGSLGRGRLKRQRAQPLACLVLERPCLVGLDRHAGELQLGPVTAMLETPEPCRLLDQRPPFGRLRRQHLLDPPLADDGVHLVAEARVPEQLEHVRAPNGGAVDEVLPLAAAVKPAGDRELRIRERPVPGGVVEQELDLAVVDTAAGTTSRRRGRPRASRPGGRSEQGSRRPTRSRRRRSTSRIRSARRRRQRPARGEPRQRRETT